MRRANAQLQADRRDEILAAAQTCFARSGFHQTSMQEICTLAGMSPGNLYRYFRSKEEIIAGIAERDRAEAARQFAAVGQGDFFDGLAALAQHHLVDRTDDEVSICAEIMAESRRHPDIRQLYQTIENDIRDRMAAMLKGAAARGEIRADLDTASIVMSIVSLCVFPFLATPLVNGALGIDTSPANAAALAEHHLAVLLDGMGTSP